MTDDEYHVTIDHVTGQWKTCRHFIQVIFMGERERGGGGGGQALVACTLLLKLNFFKLIFWIISYHPNKFRVKLFMNF